MSNITDLNIERLTIPGEPSEDVIDALRTILEMAEKGEIASVAIAATTPQSGMVTDFASVQGSGVELIGAVTVLSHRITALLAE